MSSSFLVSCHGVPCPRLPVTVTLPVPGLQLWSLWIERELQALPPVFPWPHPLPLQVMCTCCLLSETSPDSPSNTCSPLPTPANLPVSLSALLFCSAFITIWWASQALLVVKNPPANVGDIKDAGSIPALERSPGGGHGYPLQWVLGWRISQTEEPAGLQSVGLQHT